jgi:hypothetical protein
MADQDIAGLTKAQTGYVDVDDEFVVQKDGDSALKRLDVSDVFGGWRDLIAPLTAATFPGDATAPALTAFNGGNIQQLVFAVNDVAQLTFHVDHDMKQSATMYPHVHWTTDGTSTASVKWEITYTMIKGHNQDSFPAESVITVEEAASGTAYQHMVTEDGTGVATPEPDTLILVRLARVTNGTVDNVDAVFGLTVDWHYPTQMHATKNRTPNFYT